MEHLVAWIASESGAVAVYASVVVALGIMAFSPRSIRLRLRTAVLLGGIFGMLRLVATRFTLEVSDADDLNAVVTAFGAFAVTRVVFVLVVDLGVERAGKRTMNALVRDVLQGAAYLLVAVVALRVANMRPSSLIATGTVVTAVVGLALQQTLGNLAAGVSIQIDRPVGVGDWIKLDKGDVIGRVVAMNWRSVTLETQERSHFVIPNGLFSSTAFSNFSRPGGGTRQSVNVVVPNDVPPARVHEALLAACADCPHVLATPPPSVFTWTYSERGIQYWLRYWIGDYARRDASIADIYTRVWYQLHRRKIPIALPVQHQYTHTIDAATRTEREQEVLSDRRAAIEAVDFLRPLSSKAKDLLAARGHRKLFSPGEIILRQGDAGRTFYVVRRGKVLVAMNGMEITQLGAGEFFGELALLTGTQRSANVTAIGETEVFEIDETMFEEVLREDPALAERVAAIVGQREAEMEAVRSADGRPSVRDVKGFTDEILGKVRTLFALD
jgi:small-conductance mechanosensitive channel/CRP-like cAMP-binding protein